MSNNRLAYLDIAKGIGIIAVVVGHSIRPDILPAKLIGAWHMPLFYLISGLCFNDVKYSGGAKGDFLKSRMRSILQPLLCSMVFFMLMDLLSGVDHYSYHDLLAFKLPFATWFLASLFFAEVVFWLWTMLVKRIPAAGKAPLVVLCMCAAILITGCDELPYALNTIPLAVAFFGFGNIVRSRMGTLEKGFTQMSMAKKLSMPILAAGIVFAYTLYINECLGMSTNYIPQPYLATILVAIIGSVGVIMVSSLLDHATKRSASRLGEWLVFLGKNSLTILIFHMWWMRLGKAFLRPLIGVGIEPLLVWPCLLVTIYVINRYVPWFIGKKRTK